MPNALTQIQLPPDQILEWLKWAMLAFGGLWLITGVVSAMHRSAYNLTHAESGSNKKIQPDFLKVDKAKREAALARGEQFDDQLARREAPPSTVDQACSWSRLAASAAAVIGLLFTAITTLARIGPTGQALQDLSNWDALKAIVSQNQVAATLCVAVVASNAYTVIRNLQKSGGK